MYDKCKLSRNCTTLLNEIALRTTADIRIATKKNLIGTKPHCKQIERVRSIDHQIPTVEKTSNHFVYIGFQISLFPQSFCLQSRKESNQKTSGGRWRMKSLSRWLCWAWRRYRNDSTICSRPRIRSSDSDRCFCAAFNSFSALTWRSCWIITARRRIWFSFVTRSWSVFKELNEVSSDALSDVSDAIKEACSLITFFISSLIGLGNSCLTLLSECAKRTSVCELNELRLSTGKIKRKMAVISRKLDQQHLQMSETYLHDLMTWSLTGYSTDYF